MAEATLIRIATLNDLDGFNALLRETGERLYRLPSITFVATLGGRILGAIGFTWDDGCPLAGPLLVLTRAKARRRLVYRLIQAMELWIEQAGVRKYLFEIDTDNGLMLRVALSSGAREYTRTAATTWYVKEVGAHGLRAAS